MSDFRNLNQFISNVPSKHNELEDEDKIGREDIVPFVVSDEIGDMLQKKRQYVW